MTRSRRGRHLISYLIAPIVWLAAATGVITSNADQSSVATYLHHAFDPNDGFKDRFDAEVWLVDMDARLSSFMTNPSERLALLTQVHRQATQHNLAPELVLAVIEVESHFDRYAISSAGALGFMQVMPFWKTEMGRENDNLIDTVTNLQYGCQILRFYLDRESQNLSKALAAYNGSAGSDRYPNSVQAAWRQHWRLGSIDW